MIKPNSLVWAFSKPTPESTVASGRIATFIAETLKLQLVWDNGWSWPNPINIDTLIIVNGAFAFCKHLETLAWLVGKAERIVWVQNDYAIKPPGTESAAESPFRKAFRTRAQANKRGVDWWTTCWPNAAATKVSAYINWNALTYEPMPFRNEKKVPALFYYGAWRPQREAYFNRYFDPPKIDTVASSTSDKFSRFAKLGSGGTFTLVDPVARSLFYETLSKYALGLYIEDVKSHGGDHSPANRFYEMLSAGLPMVFQPEALPGLHRAGIKFTPSMERVAVLHQGMERQVLAAAMRHRITMAKHQREHWGANYRNGLRLQLLALAKNYR